MSSPRIHAAADADLDQLSASLGDSDRVVTPDRVRWMLHPPAGPGFVVTGPADSVAVFVPDSAVHADQTLPVLHRIAASGPPDALARLHRAALDHAPSAAVLAVGASSNAEIAALPTWITGPDPFVPLQRTIDDLGDAHDALGARIIDPHHWTLHRDAATWRWRYLREPGADTLLMDLPGPDGLDGLIALREVRLRSVPTLVILELRATNRHAHYALLKAARRRSWDRGGLPVVLRGERMSKRYAFTAGYLPSSSRRFGTAWGTACAPDLGPWKVWDADSDR